jgi:hypothetical protein
VHAADTVIGDADSFVGRVCHHMPQYLGAEAVVSEEDIADAGDEDA